MYKLYTPTEWYSTFRTPSIYIDDDGLIYDEADYYKSFRTPIGQFDFSTNYIYGDDYNRSFRREIGKINHCGDVIEIYGEDHFKSFAQPILYIRDGEIFSQDPRYHTFPERVGYLDGSFSGSGNLSGSDSFSSGSSYSTYRYDDYDYDSDSSSKEAGPFEMFLGVLAGLVVLAGLGALSYFLLKDSDYSTVSIYMILCGAIVALLFAKNPGSSIVITWAVTTVLLFIYDYKLSTADEPMSTFALIISVILFPFATGLVYAAPSVIAGGLAFLIKYPFIRKKQSKKK